MAIVFGILGLILIIAIKEKSPFLLIPAIIGILGFVSCLRFLKFQQGISRIGKLIGMILCGATVVLAGLSYMF